MIKGKRVKLRLFKEEDITLYMEYIQDVSIIGEFWPMNLTPEISVKKSFSENGFWSNDFGKMLIEDENGIVIGNINFFKGLHYVEGFEIGYRIFKPEYRGKGYMKEAVKLFTSYMFAIKPIKRLQIVAAEGNIPSWSVAEKSGYTYEGTLRNAFYSKGDYHNLKIYSITPSEAESFNQLV